MSDRPCSLHTFHTKKCHMCVIEKLQHERDEHIKVIDAQYSDIEKLQRELKDVRAQLMECGE